jgi:hypothetical protein
MIDPMWTRNVQKEADQAETFCRMFCGLLLTRPIKKAHNINILLFVRPETWVTERSGDMGDTFR